MRLHLILRGAGVAYGVRGLLFMPSYILLSYLGLLKRLTFLNFYTVLSDFPSFFVRILSNFSDLFILAMHGLLESAFQELWYILSPLSSSMRGFWAFLLLYSMWMLFTGRLTSSADWYSVGVDRSRLSMLHLQLFFPLFTALVGLLFYGYYFLSGTFFLCHFFSIYVRVQFGDDLDSALAPYSFFTSNFAFPFDATFWFQFFTFFPQFIQYVSC